jgi:peptidoglycan/LPS O-acetylase OafA/YrhL
MFLFYSGYGIYESIKKKGNKYSKSLLTKSLILFIKSELIILIFALRNIIYKKEITLKKYILTAFFYSSIGNSNWFAYTIILYYIYAFLSFAFIENKNYNYLGIIFITIICYLHGYFTYFYFYKSKVCAVDNTLSFILGFCYSGIRKYTDKYIMKYDFSYFGILTFFSLIYCYFYISKNKSIFMHNYINGSFSIIVVLVNMKVKFDNEFLKFLNAHSYSIYLLQRVILAIFYEKKYLENYECMRILLQFSLIILISTTFDYSTSFIDKYFKRVDKRLEPKKHIDLVGESNRNIIIKKY